MVPRLPEHTWSARKAGNFKLSYSSFCVFQYNIEKKEDSDAEDEDEDDEEFGGSSKNKEGEDDPVLRKILNIVS